MRPIVLLACAAALALSGCGNRRLILGIDALSFTTPQERTTSFGPVPALPAPVVTGEVPVVADRRVRLFDGARQLVRVESVSIAFSADVADSTGDGLDTLRVYFSDPDTAPATTAPVATLPVVLVPGQHALIEATIGADPRVNAIFLQPEMRIRVTTSLRGPSSGDPLNGSIVLTRLRAEVIARQDAL